MHITAKAPLNDIGLTHIGHWSPDDGRGDGLIKELEARGVSHDIVEIPHLIGMAGCASLVFYASPNSGRPVTVLVVPMRADVDSFAETYYTFEGMDRARALESEQAWLDLFERCREIEQRLHDRATEEAREAQRRREAHVRASREYQESVEIVRRRRAEGASVDAISAELEAKIGLRRMQEIIEQADPKMRQVSAFDWQMICLGGLAEEERRKGRGDVR